MRVLALDTTTPPGSLALWSRGRVVSQRPVQEDRPFAESLPGAALEALAESGWSLSQIDVFVVGRGPGSLTGLRVGIATAQGLAMATQRPLIGVSALEALASSVARGIAPPAPALVAAWMDARRGEVFAELFECGLREDPRSLEGPLVETPAQLAPRWLSRVGAADLVVVGNAAHATAGFWHRDGPAVHVLDAPPLAGGMAAIGARAVERGRITPPHAVVPLYVRRPDAELARARREALDRGPADAGSAS
jgi:tRNA threonylcarbamoyladenosine biosynthesis protein TsaB